MNHLLKAGFLALAILAPAPAMAQAETSNIKEMPEGSYQMDPSHTTVMFKISHLGFADYIRRFNEFNGTLNFDPDNPTENAVQVTIDAASIDVNHNKLESKLRGESAFDVDDYPQISFAASEVVWGPDSTAQIVGELQMLGQTHPVTFDAQFVGGGKNPFSQNYTMGFHARAYIDRTNWGLDAWSPAVGNDVELIIHTEFGSLQQADGI